MAHYDQLKLEHRINELFNDYYAHKSYFCPICGDLDIDKTSYGFHCRGCGYSIMEGA